LKTALILATLSMGALTAFAAAPAEQTKPAASPQAAAAPSAAEPDHIQVQHILIGFSGSVPGKNITRSLEEAKTLAYQILERAKKGENFDALVKEYTNDMPPGIYSMSNNGVAPNPGEFPRNRMVPAFGNTGFPLKVGEIGIADYDKTTSPYGYHIVKRLK
jgi:parvulin-like peptidyl-prolyl isomerase